ncbi:hypothetical protein ACWD4P_08480 [Kitasatospora sp. NPDC002543]
MPVPPPTATPDGPSLIAVAVPALALAVLLIGALAWGNHHLNRRRPRPGRGAAAARADSWRTPDGNGPRPSEREPADREEGRSPDRRARNARPPRRSS